jgi:hypothetical protein
VVTRGKTEIMKLVQVKTITRNIFVADSMKLNKLECMLNVLVKPSEFFCRKLS